MGGIRAARQADDSPASIGVPVRSPQAHEGWHQVDSPVVWHRGRQSLNIRAIFDDAKAIAQPLHCGTGNKDASFQRVSNIFPYAPGDSRQQAILRRHSLVTGIHQHEAASTIGVLRHTGIETCLSKSGSLLVSSITCHLNGPTEELRVGLAVDFTR